MILILFFVFTNAFSTGINSVCKDPYDMVSSVWIGQIINKFLQIVKKFIMAFRLSVQIFCDLLFSQMLFQQELI